MSYYFIQDRKSKTIFKKYATLEDAVEGIKSLKKQKHTCEIIATEISDCYSCQTRLYNREELYKVIDKTSNYIELDGGRWIRSCGDGRYYLNGNDNVKFAAVCINCYDNNGDFIHGEPIGYVQV